MLACARPLACSLLVGGFFLGGCATRHAGHGRHVPDWEAEEVANAQPVVAPAPEPQASLLPPPAVVTSSPSAAIIVQPAPPVVPQEKWVALFQWCQEHQLPPPRASGGGSDPGFSISTSNGVFA